MLALMDREAEEVQRHAERAGQALFFLTDSRELRNAVSARYPAVITSTSQLGHVGNDASDYFVAGLQDWMRTRDVAQADVVRDALADWWLLAQVDGLAGSIISGFSRSALLASHAGVWFWHDQPCLLDTCCEGTMAKAKDCFFWGSGA